MVVILHGWNGGMSIFPLTKLKMDVHKKCRARSLIANSCVPAVDVINCRDSRELGKDCMLGPIPALKRQLYRVIPVLLSNVIFTIGLRLAVLTTSSPRLQQRASSVSRGLNLDKVSSSSENSDDRAGIFDGKLKFYCQLGYDIGYRIVRAESYNSVVDRSRNEIE